MLLLWLLQPDDKPAGLDAQPTYHKQSPLFHALPAFFSIPFLLKMFRSNCGSERKCPTVFGAKNSQISQLCATSSVLSNLVFGLLAISENGH
jgi:hypothetical protein